MNRFERLFFILEKNPTDAGLGTRDVRGVVKIVLTTEQIRVMWELTGLPLLSHTQYAIVVFLQKKESQQLQPTYFSFQPNAYGNARMENVLRHSLQEGERIFGVALSVLEEKTETKRRFPMVAFQDMHAPWQEMLQSITGKEKQEKDISSPPKDKQITRVELVEKIFLSCDPFGTTNPSYRWWRSTDMHRLNQLLSKMNMALPLELNKEGYLACGLFGHVLLGLYTDKTLQREFFILGIPAKSQNDSGNYYSHSRWERLGKQAIPEQEETGYWLTYIDCNTSKVVKVV